MAESDDLRYALQEDPAAIRRAQRAARMRAGALSPMRVVRYLLYLPVLTAVIGLSVYIRTSPYEPPEAVMHLAALAGCEAAGWVGVAPSRRGDPGYHARNDHDGDGVACEVQDSLGGGVRQSAGVPAAESRQRPAARVVGGAKFVRP